MADALSHLKFISSDNKVMLDSSSMFSGNLETLWILWMMKKSYFLLLKRIPLRMLINISVTPNLSELEAFIDEEYDEYGEITTAYSQRTVFHQ